MGGVSKSNRKSIAPVNPCIHYRFSNRKINYHSPHLPPAIVSVSLLYASPLTFPRKYHLHIKPCSYATLAYMGCKGLDWYIHAPLGSGMGLAWVHMRGPDHTPTHSVMA
jgi:hypothetical protein